MRLPDRGWLQAQYASADPVHDFAHIERVVRLAEQIAQAEGADVTIVTAAAWLHDLPGVARGDHHRASAATAEGVLRELGWPDAAAQAVADCIRTHRFRVAEGGPQTLEAQCLFDADKLDAIGAIGVARAVVYAALHGAPFYARPSAQFLETGTRAVDELHSAYHEYWAKLRHIVGRLYTPTGRALGAQRQAAMDAYFVALAAEMGGE